MNDQTIFRRAKDRDNPFVMIDKNVFENPDLSWKAKGLMGYLLSRPDDWIVRMGDLANRSTEGMSSVKTVVKELIDHGYLVRDCEQDERGRFHWSVEVHEVPVERPSAVYPSADKLSTDRPLAESQPSTDTNCTETECTKKEADVSAGDLPDKSILEYSDPLSMMAECQRRTGGKKSFTVVGPEGADPWANGPVEAFCKLAHMPTAPPGSVTAWARAFEKIAGGWGATPADVVTAIKMIPKDNDHKWRSFTSPLMPSFKGLLDVMIARVLSGETGKIVRIRN